MCRTVLHAQFNIVIQKIRQLSMRKNRDDIDQALSRPEFGVLGLAGEFKVK